MKTSLGTEVDLGPGHIVWDGVPAVREMGTAAPPPLFGPCLLWPRSIISATAELLLWYLFSILAKIWLPRQRPVPYSFAIRNVFFGVADHENPVTSNHILVICRRNAVIRTLVPRLVAIVTPLCALCTGVSQVNSLIAETLSQTLHGYVACGIQLKLWSFCVILLHILANIWLSWQRPLDTCKLQSEMSSLD